MNAHTPNFNGSLNRDIVEHALEFCDVLDSVSLAHCISYVRERKAELEDILPYEKEDDGWTAEHVLCDMALSLLQLYRADRVNARIKENLA